MSRPIDRRRFLSLLGGLGAIGAAAGCSGAGARISAPPETAVTAEPRAGSAAVTDADAPAAQTSHTLLRNENRRLVVVELSGGNDGLATLQPYGSGVLHTERPNLVIDDAELVDAGAGFGWSPALAGLAERGLAAAVGIGSAEPDYSHFEMEQRWWRGASGDDDRTPTGFLGRLCDQLDDAAPVTGLSLAGGPTPALAADKAVTVGLADPGISWFFNQDDSWFAALRRAYGAMAKASAGDNSSFQSARDGLHDTLRFAEALSEIPNEDQGDYPWTDIGQQMRFAAEVLALDVGVRVLHLQLGGFDTHSEQSWQHPGLLAELAEAAVPFLHDLDARALLEDTLVVTTSEFGRRVASNDGGTDHGGASTMLVFGGGSGRSGVHGVAPDLTRLDAGNLVATARFEDYYATIAEDWFGISAADVLPAGGDPITGLI